MTRTEVLYWKADYPEQFTWTNFPAFICYTEHEDPYYHIYGIPILEYPGLVKVRRDEYSVKIMCVIRKVLDRKN